ncbi:hypothetical protein QE394_001031 [Arthrobacter sp. SORGH_AS 212]|uniref:hypothetical protein n=1 Tax=Pseudarthrobacter sp. SORGH_AS 212 TaxID=3041777 RepID=UPI00278B83DF|nr:hypothetical protein [Arthrobacter sp. SORGH_AS_0212]
MTTAQARLRDAVSSCLNSHDLLGVLDLGAPNDEYDPETEEFTHLLAAGEFVTAEVVAAVWHKWFGEADRQAPAPTPEMATLAADLQALAPLAGL